MLSLLTCLSRQEIPAMFSKNGLKCDDYKDSFDGSIITIGTQKTLCTDKCFVIGYRDQQAGKIQARVKKLINQTKDEMIFSDTAAEDNYPYLIFHKQPITSLKCNSTYDCPAQIIQVPCGVEDKDDENTIFPRTYFHINAAGQGMDVELNPTLDKQNRKSVMFIGVYPHPSVRQIGEINKDVMVTKLLPKDGTKFNNDTLVYGVESLGFYRESENTKINIYVGNYSAYGYPGEVLIKSVVGRIDDGAVHAIHRRFELESDYKGVYALDSDTYPFIPDEPKGSLGAGAIAAIVIVVLLVVGGVAGFCVWFFIFKNKGDSA